MAIPWMLALRAIPWTTLLANAPGLLRSANGLLARGTGETGVPSRPGSTAPSPSDVQALRDRIAALEQRDRETAELLADVTAQVAALTTASDVLQARTRWLLVLAVVAVLAAVAAGGIALVAAR